MKSITKLITSLALMGILTLTIVMSTVAWFSANREVNATGITVSAGVETYMDMGTLTYSSGSLTPAVARVQVGSGQGALGPLDMFDTTTPKVGTRAVAVKYTTNIHYVSENQGTLNFNVTATISGSSVDYVTYGEFAYIAVFDCGNVIPNKKVLLYGYYDAAGTLHQEYYYNSSEGGASVYSGFANISDVGNTWYPVSSSVSNIFNGTQMILRPGKDYSVTLYVFPAKTDEEIDPVLLGANVTITSLIDVQNSEVTR